MTPAEKVEKEKQREEHLVKLYMEVSGATREEARDVYERLKESGKLGKSKEEESKPAPGPKDVSDGQEPGP